MTSNGPPALDLGLFRLPVHPSPTNAETELSSRPDARSRIKRDFWARLARRINLTGQGSLVEHRPWGVDLDSDPSPLATKAEALVDALEKRAADALVLVSEEARRPSNLHERVASVIKDVTPQFFLRNIPRLERNVDVRRPAIKYAVWRNDEEVDLHFAEVRFPKHHAPELIDELSTVWVRKVAAEIRHHVLGFSWEDADMKKKAVREVHHSLLWDIEKVDVKDISLEPAPPNRVLPEDKWSKGMQELHKLFDGSTTEEDKEKKKQLKPRLAPRHRGARREPWQ